MNASGLAAKVLGHVPRFRFYFDIRENGVTTPDDIGVDLLDVETARTEATRALAQMAKEAKRFPVAFGAVIRDENFEPLCELDSLVRLRPPH